MLDREKTIEPRVRQKEAIEYIVENITDFPLIEAPTGFGKTIVLLLSAIELQKRGKTVIISTPNNKLTIDAYREAIGYYPELSIDFRIGIKNYIDIDRLNACKNDGILEKYVELDSLKKWEDAVKDEEYLIYDDFSEAVTFVDIAYRNLVQEFICKVSGDGEALFKEGYITFTNHFFLLSSMRSVKKENVKDLVVLVDEVHELSSVAEVIFQNNFSPFYLKSTVSTLMTELKNSKEDFTGKKSLLKDLSAVYYKISSEFSHIMRNSEKSKIGEFDNKKVYFQSLASMNSEAVKSLQARLSKLSKKNIVPVSNRGVISAISNELAELKNISDSFNSGNEISVFLSPSKGYPNYKSVKGVISFLISNFLWGKLSGGAGLSATLNTTVRITENVNKKFAYGRIGLNHKTAPEIKTFERDFPKENVKLVTKPIGLYSLDYESDEPGADNDLIRWANEIASHVLKTYDNKRSMIIVGSFKEAEYLEKAFKDLDFYDVISAKRDLKTSQVIKQFIDNGTIMIGTRNFGVGISLNGDLLERLYIAKLPYPQVESVKWIKLKEYNTNLFWINFNNEMIMQLRQFFGRLQRTKDDKGEIHLLDARGIRSEDKKFSQSIVSKVSHYMNEYGVLDKDKSVEIHKPNVERYEINAELEDDLF